MWVTAERHPYLSWFVARLVVANITWSKRDRVHSKLCLLVPRAVGNAGMGWWSIIVYNALWTMPPVPTFSTSMFNIVQQTLSKEWISNGDINIFQSNKITPTAPPKKRKDPSTAPLRSPKGIGFGRVRLTLHKRSHWECFGTPWFLGAVYGLMGIIHTDGLVMD